jgi:hypothetical protein
MAADRVCKLTVTAAAIVGTRVLNGLKRLQMNEITRIIHQQSSQYPLIDTGQEQQVAVGNKSH